LVHELRSTAKLVGESAVSVDGFSSPSAEIWSWRPSMATVKISPGYTGRSVCAVLGEQEAKDLLVAHQILGSPTGSGQ
jgi:hypothetical protein